MSALRETPPAPAPASDPAMKWLAGCGFGCLAIVILVVVATVGIVSWLGREGPARPEEVLADGNERAAFTLDLRPDDPAVLEMLRAMQVSAMKVGGVETQVKLPPFFQSMERDDLRRHLPVRLDVVRWAGTEEAPAPWIARATLGSGAWRARFTLRLVSWMVARGELASRETFQGVEILVAGQPPGAFAAAVVQNRLLFAGDAATLRRALAGGGAVDPERAALPQAVRFDGEDARGYLRPEADAQRAVAAASFDVASRDVVRFRVAVRSEAPPADPAAAAREIEESVTKVLQLNELRIVREGEPYWLDPATLVLAGRLEGVEGLVSSFFSARAQEPANP